MHSVVKEPRRAGRILLETLANDDSDTREFEDEKDPGTRQVKRMISLDEESTRPARRPKNSKYPEMEKTTDKVGVFSHRLSSYLESVLGSRSIKEDKQATKSIVKDGLHCFCLRFNELVSGGPVYADCLSIVIVYQ